MSSDLKETSHDSDCGVGGDTKSTPLQQPLQQLADKKDSGSGNESDSIRCNQIKGRFSKREKDGKQLPLTLPPPLGLRCRCLPPPLTLPPLLGLHRRHCLSPILPAAASSCL